MIRQWPLVGRSEELAVIAEATRASTDRARGIVLSGAAGVGKTRVAREVVASCGPRGATRHWIIGTASARSIPLGAFAEIASDFGPDPLRRVREVIDGLIGDRQPGEVVVGAGDGAALIDASRQYEEFGDRIAAADAVVAYQSAGLRGAAMTASTTAQRLATECQGARTPALRAATTPQPFTGRQLEIISLAAQGLSNKEIADRLTMSIRSVEGHLFRASQRVGANSREQLISLLRGP